MQSIKNCRAHALLKIKETKPSSKIRIYMINRALVGDRSSLKIIFTICKYANLLNAFAIISFRLVGG